MRCAFKRVAHINFDPWGSGRPKTPGNANMQLCDLIRKTSVHAHQGRFLFEAVAVVVADWGYIEGSSASQVVRDPKD